MVFVLMLEGFPDAKFCSALIKLYSGLGIGLTGKTLEPSSPPVMMMPISVVTL
jgi:hypothetical protein